MLRFRVSSLLLTANKSLSRRKLLGQSFLSQTSTGGSDDKSSSRQVVAFGLTWDELKPRLFYGTIGSITFYGISRIMYDLTYEFLALTPYGSLKYGFYGGCLSSIVFGAATYSSLYALTISPDHVFRISSSLVLQNKDLAALIGKASVAESLKTYKHVTGNIVASGGFPAWKPPQLYMMYVCNGAKGGQAIVNVLCTKENLKYKLEFVGVEVLGDQNKKLTLVGEETGFEAFSPYRKYLSYF